MARFGRKVTLLSALREIERASRRSEKARIRHRRANERAAAQQERVAAQYRQLQEAQRRLTSVNVKLNDETGKLEFLDSDGDELSVREKRLAWEQLADKLFSMLEAAAAEVNLPRQAIVNIHADTPSHEDGLAEYEAAPFGKPMPSLREPIRPVHPLEPSKPRIDFLDRLFVLPAATKQRHYEEAQQRYQASMQVYGEDMARFEAEKITAKAMFDRQLSDWGQEKRRHDEAERVAAAQHAERMKSDTAYMEQVLEGVLAEVEWPRETLVDYELVAGGAGLHMDVDLPEVEDMPERSAAVDQDGKKIKFSKISEKQRREDYARHVHGILLRLLGIAFMTLPSLNSVIISGYSQRKQKKTGEVGDEYLLSLSVTREAYGKVPPVSASTDPIAIIDSLPNIKKMNASFQFTAIEPYLI